MDRIARLDAIVAKYNLNTHPFYTSWREGTLPRTDLVDYAGEYGRFVGLIADGWETLGEKHYAEEERVHEVLWQDFKEALACGSISNHASTETLVSTAGRLFNGTSAEALGALYAFEAQQPHTSQTKLEGLREHYPVGAKGEEYFIVHAGDVAEAALLRERSNELSDQDFETALTACEELCKAMWGALDGVYSLTTEVQA